MLKKLKRKLLKQLRGVLGKNQLPNICPSLFEGLFFILEELRDNIKEMHLFGYTQPLSHYFLYNFIT